MGAQVQLVGWSMQWVLARGVSGSHLNSMGTTLDTPIYTMVSARGVVCVSDGHPLDCYERLALLHGLSVWGGRWVGLSHRYPIGRFRTTNCYQHFTRYGTAS